jgi:uncharacterized phage protein gp47/JayE
MVSTLNRVKYSGLDFSTIFDDLRSRIQIKFAADFNDFALSQLGIMLVDVVAFGLDALSFYVDRRATDLYLSTARTRKAVARLTRQLGYKMRAAVASSTDLRVAILNPQAFSIPIAKGFQFQGPNDLIFEAAQDVVFAPGSGPSTFQTVPVFEGQTITETFVSTGAPNQLFELRRVPDSSFVVAGTVQVKVNGADFTEVEFLSFDSTDQVEIGYNDDPPTIRFGDGVTGNIPTTTATIQVTYVASRGKTGQVSKETIDDVVSPLVVNFTAIRLSVINPEGSVGGDDLEDIEHAKTFAGKVNKSRDVAVTRGDYEALAGSFQDPLFGRVAVAQAISSRSAESDLLLQTLLFAITAAIIAPKPTVDAELASANAALDDVDTQLGILSSSFTDIASKASDIVTDADSAITSARASKNRAADAGNDSQDIQDLVVSGKAAVDAIATAGSSQLTTGDKASLKNFFDQINSQATSIFSASGDIDASSVAEIALLGAIKDKAHDIGVTTVETGSLLLAAETARADIEIQVGVIPPSPTGIRSNLSVIGDTIQDETATVAQIIADINTHVGEILSADCKANLVTVPILARDSAGFYALPSSSLIQALQVFLDARKEVTHTVTVVSGINFLVRVVMTVRVGIRVGVSTQVVKAAVETAIDGVLRGRLFGASLYTSDLVDAIKPVEGVAFANVNIQGYLGLDGVTLIVSKIDTDGNLIITSNEVITKGTVTVNTEILAS